MKQWILNLAMGLVLMVGGAWLAVYQLQHPPVVKGLLYTFVGIALLGALLINPTPIIGSVKQIVVVLLPVLPWAKGSPPPSATVVVVPSDEDKK